MKYLFALFLIGCHSYAYSQFDIQTFKGNQQELSAELNGNPIEFERPVNFFLAAGINYSLGKKFDATISPTDYSVQFQQLNNFTTSISTGMVWNPFKAKHKEDTVNLRLLYKDGETEVKQCLRNPLALALLINIFQLDFSSEDINTTSPLDVGIGLGLRRWDFMVLATIEFKYQRQARSYFFDSHYDNNLPLIPAGNSEPVQTLDINDDQLFYNKIFPSIGIKIAYAFTKKSL